MVRVADVPEGADGRPSFLGQRVGICWERKGRAGRMEAVSPMIGLRELVEEGRKGRKGREGGEGGVWRELLVAVCCVTLSAATVCM